MVPPLSALSLALYHEALEGGCSPTRNIWNQQLEPANGNQQMKPANGNHEIAKRNFPSCSLCSQFTASQKLPLLFPNAKHMESATGTSKWEPANETSKWEPSNRKRKLPLLLTLFAIHCLTKASAFVPQCKNIWSQQLETIICLCTFNASGHRTNI